MIGDHGSCRRRARRWYLSGSGPGALSQVRVVMALIGSGPGALSQARVAMVPIGSRSGSGREGAAQATSRISSRRTDRGRAVSSRKRFHSGRAFSSPPVQVAPRQQLVARVRRPAGHRRAGPPRRRPAHAPGNRGRRVGDPHIPGAAAGQAANIAQRQREGRGARTRLRVHQMRKARRCFLALRTEADAASRIRPGCSALCRR